MAAVATGKKAPEFELSGIDGKKLSLHEGLARGPVLAAFFKVSCPVCQYTFPFLERMLQQFRAAGAKGIQVWGIAQDNAEYTHRFAKEFGVTFPILIDDEPYETSAEYGLTHVPTLVLIAPGGQVKISGDGFSKSDLLEIRRWLAQHFNVKPAELFKPNEQIPAYKPG
jgi:peroxiredoxin